MRGDATGGDRSGGARYCGLSGAPSGVSVPVSVGCTGGCWHRGRASAKQQAQGLTAEHHFVDRRRGMARRRDHAG